MSPHFGGVPDPEKLAEAMAAFRRQMREVVIPEAQHQMLENARRVAEIRHVPFGPGGIHGRPTGWPNNDG